MSTNTASPAAPAHSEVLRSWLTPPVVALTGTALIFGALGVAGVAPWADWPVPLRWALAAMFLLTASARLGSRRGDLEAMVPAGLPRPGLLVALTGALEALGALGLLLPATASTAGWCLAALLVAVFPANIHAARAGVSPDSPVSPSQRRVTPLRIRTTQQILFLTCAVVSASWSPSALVS
jgi:uncharacterized membrane protein